MIPTRQVKADPLSRTSMYKQGTPVRLNVPENPRLHGASGIVEKLEEWGATVKVKASGSGEFRAAWSEMTLEPMEPTRVNGAGYTGNCCRDCGGVRMVRNGTCEICNDCGNTSGCS